MAQPGDHLSGTTDLVSTGPWTFDPVRLGRLGRSVRADRSTVSVPTARDGHGGTVLARTTGNALLIRAHRLRAAATQLDPRTTTTLGAVGGLLILLGTLFVGRLARTPSTRELVLLHRSPHAQTWGHALVFVGLAVLLGAWGLLGLRVRGRNDGVRAVLVAAAVWSVPLLLTAPTFSGDVWSYVANAMIVAKGLSPYVVPPADLTGPIVHAVSSRWLFSPAPYGPVPLLWGGAAAHLTSSPWLGVLAFRLLALVGLLLLAVAVPRLARATGRDPASATWLAVASPFTLLHGVASAHVDLLMAGLMAASLLVALRGRWFAAALLVGMAAAVKVPALLAVVPVALAVVHTTRASGWQARVRAHALVAGVAVAALWSLGTFTGIGNGWVSGLSTPLSSRSPLALTTQLGLVVSHLLHEQVLGAAHDVGTGLLTVVVAWTVLRASTRTPGDVVRAGAMVASCTVLVSPVEHLWYFFWCLPFLACAPLGRGARRVTTAVTVALAAVAPFDAGQHLPGSRALMAGGILAAFLAGVRLRRAAPAQPLGQGR